MTDKRKHKYEAAFVSTDQLKAGEGLALSDYATAEEAKLAREALYNHWKITGLNIYREIKVITPTAFWVQDLRSPSLQQEEANLCYNLEELFSYLKEVTEDEELTITACLHKTKLISFEDFCELNDNLLVYRKENKQKIRDRETQNLAIEIMGGNRTYEPLTELTPEEAQAELEQLDREIKENLDQAKKNNAEALEEAKKLYPERFIEQPKEPADETTSAKKQSLKQILADAEATPTPDLPDKNPVANPFKEGENQ